MDEDLSTLITAAAIFVWCLAWWISCANHHHPPEVKLKLSGWFYLACVVVGMICIPYLNYLVLIPGVLTLGLEAYEWWRRV